MAKIVSQDCVKSYIVGLNKGYVTTKLPKRVRPCQRKGRSSNRTREIRNLVLSVTGLTPLEKRVTELLKTGVTKVVKRAFKMLRKRLGTRKRAMKKRDMIETMIKNM